MVRPGIQQTSSSVYYFSQDGSDFVISLWMKPHCATILINAIEQFFHEVLFILLQTEVVISSSLSIKIYCEII